MVGLHHQPVPDRCLLLVCVVERQHGAVRKVDQAKGTAMAWGKQSYHVLRPCAHEHESSCTGGGGAMARLQQLSTFYADESPGIRISPVSPLCCDTQSSTHITYYNIGHCVDDEPGVHPGCDHPAHLGQGANDTGNCSEQSLCTHLYAVHAAAASACAMHGHQPHTLLQFRG